MIKSAFITIVLTLFSLFSFSQDYSEDNKKFVYQNRRTFEIINKEVNNELKTFVKISEEHEVGMIVQETEFNTGIQDVDLYFGNFIDKKRKFILINTRYYFYILNLYNNKLLGPYKPNFWGIGQDAQSGMLTDIKIILDGRFLIGYCVDSGTFLFDLTNLYKPHEVFSANVPYCHENHVYILQQSDNKQKSFGLYVSTKDRQVDSKIIFNNKTVKYDDYSDIKQTSEIEFEKMILGCSLLDSQYTILKEILPNNDYKYIVIYNYTGQIINLPVDIEKSDKLEVKKYLEKP